MSTGQAVAIDPTGTGRGRRRTNPSLVVGGLLVLAVVLTALLSFVWTPYDPTFVDSTSRLLKPSAQHWFGTDKFGRDVLSQIIVGSRTTLFVGFVAVGVAALVGVPLGILAGSWRVLEAAGHPVALFGRNLPVAALIPLTILWFGIDETQKVMFIFIACVPFVYSEAVGGIAAVPDRYIETAQTLGASELQIVRKVLVPLALPTIYNGLRRLFGLAFGYIMLAELINANYGLGKLLMDSQRRSIPEHVILILLIISLLAYGIDRFLLWFQRGLFPYRTVEG